jgi:hypothetical protein
MTKVAACDGRSRRQCGGPETRQPRCSFNRIDDARHGAQNGGWNENRRICEEGRMRLSQLPGKAFVADLPVECLSQFVPIQGGAITTLVQRFRAIGTGFAS